MMITESDRTTDEDVCPTHDRVHQPREREVQCWICRHPTMHPHGTHLRCDDAMRDVLR